MKDVYYYTSELVAETGVKPHTLRRYIRILESNDDYPEIKRDDSGNRLYSELDKHVILEMVALIRDKKERVEEAAQSVIDRLDDIRADIERKEAYNVPSEQLNGSDRVIELLERILINQNDLDNKLNAINERLDGIEERQRLIEYDEDQEDGSNADQGEPVEDDEIKPDDSSHEPVEDVEVSKEDEQQPGSLSDYRTVEDKPKKKAGILSRLFGKS